jgi:energy-coupling factor transporter ATP-binding protein EcfA2
MAGLRATRIRVQNFRNVDDSGWVNVDRVTALVGRNESGKTAILQALHKFNPATRLPYVAQREFPRDRFQSEYTAADSKTIPVASVEFAIEEPLLSHIQAATGPECVPRTATYTRYYGGNMTVDYEPPITNRPVDSATLTALLDNLANTVRRIESPNVSDEALERVRGEILTWVAERRKAVPTGTLRNEVGRELLSALLTEVAPFGKPATADAVEVFNKGVTDLATEAESPETLAQVIELTDEELPVFIYFEDYGILDSAVYLPQFIADLERVPDDSKVRTINAVFSHVRLTATEIHDLGQEKLAPQILGHQPTPEEIAAEQQRKELRAIELNSASLDITNKFSNWWHQRRHQIRYHADGDFFRIWISDDRRPGVEIELESRSKGFQWFFSFYLVFLVESEEGHKNAVLLLDEPGLHLHPTAQQELISFFEELAAKNQLIYTTHSPFLIDGEHLARVRTVQETEAGRSEISEDVWPADRETNFPLQAALGYSMMQTLFTGKRNALVEGLSDYLYIHGLSLALRAAKKSGLPDDVYITPCGGTKLVGHLASLFIGQGVRPMVLLDDDEAGRARAGALAKDLYRGHESVVLLISAAVPGSNAIEDVIGEEAILTGLGELGVAATLTEQDRQATSVAGRVLAWSKRTGTELPEGWKVDVARNVVNAWSAEPPTNTALLERGEKLVTAIAERA